MGEAAGLDVVRLAEEVLVGLYVEDLDEIAVGVAVGVSVGISVVGLAVREAVGLAVVGLSIQWECVWG